MSRVVTRVERAEAGLVSRLGEFGVATIHEAQGRTGLMLPHMRPIYRGARLSGSAVTVAVPPGDNLMIHVAVEQCGAGDVMVVVPTSACDNGYFGELLATSLQSRGVAGLIIEAGVRDVAALEDMKFPVWSKAISAQGTVKETLGSVNVRVTCAGTLIDPGDVIAADDDGVVVVPRAKVQDVLTASEAREQREADNRKRLKAGELGLDIYGIRAKLAGKGIRYE